MTMNKIHVIHMLVCFIYLKKKIESSILMSGMSIVWEDTGGWFKKYRFDLAIYLITVLSYSYGIIMNFSINAPGHGKNDVDGLSPTERKYLKGKWNLLAN